MNCYCLKTFWTNLCATKCSWSSSSLYNTFFSFISFCTYSKCKFYVTFLLTFLGILWDRYRFTPKMVLTKIECIQIKISVSMRNGWLKWKLEKSKSAVEWNYYRNPNAVLKKIAIDKNKPHEWRNLATKRRSCVHITLIDFLLPLSHLYEFLWPLPLTSSQVHGFRNEEQFAFFTLIAYWLLVKKIKLTYPIVKKIVFCKMWEPMCVIFMFVQQPCVRSHSLCLWSSYAGLI